MTQGFARSCIVCTNVAESGVTFPNVGLVISSGVQRMVSTDIRTGSTVNALQTLSKAQFAPATRLHWSNRPWNSCHDDEPWSVTCRHASKVHRPGTTRRERRKPYDIAFTCGREIFCETSVPLSAAPDGANAHQGEDVPAWDLRYKRSNESGTCHSMHGSTV